MIMKQQPFHHSSASGQESRIPAVGSTRPDFANKHALPKNNR